MRLEKIKYMLLGGLVTLILIGGIVFFSNGYAAETLNRIQFATHEGAYKFFDSQTGKIYSYSETGKLKKIYLLTALGSDLKKIK